MHTVYILCCHDGKHYIGCTGNLSKRLEKHNQGLVSFTKSRLPIEVLVTVNFRDKYKAYFFERYLKPGSGRAFGKRHFY